MTDISSLSIDSSNDEGAPMTLVHPVTGDDLLNDDEKPMKIYLVGSDSPEFRVVQSRIDAKYRSRKPPSFGQKQSHAIELLVACTKRFENLQVEGEIVSFTDDTAKILYKTFPWIKDQVDEFVGERANHLGNSATD